jgi:hypothetical protein
MMKMPNGPGKATALFNGVNFLLFALIGGLCLLWPLISGWFESRSSKDSKENEEKSNGAECKANDDAVIVAVDSNDVKTSDDARDLEVESKPAKPAAEPSAAVAKPAKRQLVYLQNMKAFMTAQVITVHTLCQFTILCSEGMGTRFFIGDPNTYPGPWPRSFITFALFIMGTNQDYFMSAFFLISAYFCVKSLDRKGFRQFVIDKLVRLGGPFILWSALLNPLLYMWNNAYAGSYPLQYSYGAGPPWFILWLLNFTLIYAMVAQVLPSLHFKMPHPLLLLVLGVGLGGVFYAIDINIGDWNYSFDMTQWTFGLAIYVPFFVAGIAGGRNDWLRSVENMATWLVWCLRIVCVGFWVLIFLEIGQLTIPQLDVQIDMTLAKIKQPVYSMAMLFAVMQLFHQYLNTTFDKKWVVSVGAAAYAVYVIHPWVFSLFILIFVEILKAAKVPIVWDYSNPSKPAYYTVDYNGDLAVLPDSYLWGGWIFVFVLTQLVVWPLAHYFRKLPVMNKML